MMNVLRRREREGHARIGAETEVVQLQGKKCQGFLAAATARREAQPRFSFKASRRNPPWYHLDFGLLACSTAGEYFSAVGRSGFVVIGTAALGS